MNDNELSLVMPVFNEGECIAEVVTSWYNQLASMNLKFEILVINDCSTDDSKAKLEKLQQLLGIKLLNNEVNLGHGASLMLGYQAALQTKSDWIFHVDSDNQFIAKDFEKIWNARSKSAFVVGTRKNRKDGIVRFFITKILQLTIVALFQKYIRDANSPYRLIAKSFLTNSLPMIPKGFFAPNILLSVIAKRSLPIIIEIPITHLARKTGKSSIIKWSLIRACLISAKQLLKARNNTSERKA
jgi:glycosyltransferase involved in cell wall biosynthesis